jgi:hypothetical protein
MTGSIGLLFNYQVIGSESSLECHLASQRITVSVIFGLVSKEIRRDKWDKISFVIIMIINPHTYYLSQARTRNYSFNVLMALA